MSRFFRGIVVSEIQSLLGLTECRKTGTEALSGGQKKRLSIALELINNPPVLFLDEPTSGLDNVSTAYTLRLLRTLAHQGRTIVCTIHQPSASLFQLFDHVYVLSAGLCVYQGATQELVPFLSSVGLPCPTHYNPADFVIEMTDGDDNQNISVLSAATGNGKITMKLSTTSLVESQEQQTNNENGLRGEASNNNNRQLAASLMNYQRTSEAVKSKEWCPDLSTSYWSQFITLFCRMFLQIRRNRLALKIQFYHHVGCGLAVGIVFYDMARDGDQFFNHMKFCMGVILFHVYTQCMVPVLTFPYEVKLMKKELFNRWYSLRSYYLALTFSKVPTLVIFSLMFLTIVYALSGLPLELHRFIVFCFVGVMTAFVAEGLGQAIGSVFSVTNGSAVGPMTIAPFLGFAIYGFDFAKSIPIWLVPLLKTSFLRSGVIALVITVFGMGRGRLDCYHPMYCHFKDPRVIIHYLDLDNVSPWVEIGSMFAMLLIFKVLCYLGLMWRVRT